MFCQIVCYSTVTKQRFAKPWLKNTHTFTTPLLLAVICPLLSTATIFVLSDSHFLTLPVAIEGYMFNCRDSPIHKLSLFGLKLTLSDLRSELDDEEAEDCVGGTKSLLVLFVASVFAFIRNTKGLIFLTLSALDNA